MPLHVDMHDPAFAREPYGTYAELRQKCPVMRSLLHGKFWLLSRTLEVNVFQSSAACFTSSYRWSMRTARCSPMCADARRFHFMVRKASSTWTGANLS